MDNEHRSSRYLVGWLGVDSAHVDERPKVARPSFALKTSGICEVRGDRSTMIALRVHTILIEKIGCAIVELKHSRERMAEAIPKKVPQEERFPLSGNRI